MCQLKFKSIKQTMKYILVIVVHLDSKYHPQAQVSKFFPSAAELYNKVMVYRGMWDNSAGWWLGVLQRGSTKSTVTWWKRHDTWTSPSHLHISPNCCAISRSTWRRYEKTYGTTSSSQVTNSSVKYGTTLLQCSGGKFLSKCGSWGNIYSGNYPASPSRRTRTTSAGRRIYRNIITSSERVRYSWRFCFYSEDETHPQDA